MSRELAVRAISLLQITFPRNSVHFASGTTDSAYTLTTKPHAAKGREPLEPAALDGELNHRDAFPKMSFHAFSDLPTLKQSASACVFIANVSVLTS